MWRRAPFGWALAGKPRGLACPGSGSPGWACPGFVWEIRARLDGLAQGFFELAWMGLPRVFRVRLVGLAQRLRDRADGFAQILREEK